MRRIASALFLCAALSGQTATVIMPAPGKEPDTLAQLARRLKREPHATWLLLEGPGGTWLPEFSRMLQNDDDLMPMGLRTRTLGPSAPLAAELRQMQGWGPEAAWALIGDEGQVLESGRGPKPALQLAELLASHGIRGEIRELEAFVSRTPDHLQATEKLLERYLNLADRRTLARLKPRPEGSGEDAPPAELERPLTEAEDAQIWGRAADLMERLILGGDWRLGTIYRWGGRRYTTGRFSPLMVRASRRCIPRVEEALRQHPGLFPAWTVWVQLSDNLGGRPLRPLLDSIQLAPGEQDAAPESVFDAYVRDARARGDWNGIIEVLGPRWGARKDLQVKVFSVGEGKGEDPLKPTWEGLIKPLVEAHIRLGNAQEADRMIREAMAWMPSRALPGWASGLAQRCGQPYLAAQWAGLSVPRG